MPTRCCSILLAGLLPGCLAADLSPAGTSEAPAAPDRTEAPLPAVASGPVEAAALGTTPNVHRRGDIWFAGQPADGDYEVVAAAGIRTVLDHRPEGEAAFDSAARCSAVGVHHERIGFNGADALTDDVLDRTRRTLLLAPRPILVHCSSANRVAATWLAWRVIDEEAAFDDALAEARTIGLRTEAYIDVVRGYIDRHQRREAEATVAEHERWALEAAVADERRAQATYAAVIKRFGARPPFTNLVGAEGRHAEMAARAMRRLGLTVPPPERLDIVAPETFADALRVAIRAEEDNIALFDRLIPLARHDDVRRTFERLQDRSRTRHLPALQRTLDRESSGG